jgi:hypothetical protein
LAALALVFAIQVMFDIQNASSDAGTVFVSRLFVSALIAAAFTFLWNHFQKTDSK